METQNIKAPLDRVAVIIGKKGETKKAIQKKTGTKIDVDSESGDVELSGSDPVSLLKAASIVRAIARGFSPENAFLLLDDEYMLDVIGLSEQAHTKKELETIRGRIIGTRGKARKKIEEETHSFISVYGKTVSIIAKIDDLPNARKGIEMLLRGAGHSNVYSTLKKLDSKKFELE